jgi:hypothetical protein
MVPKGEDLALAATFLLIVSGKGAFVTWTAAAAV